MWFDLFDHFDPCRSILWFICGVLLIKYYIIHCRQMLFINNTCTNLFFGCRNVLRFGTGVLVSFPLPLSPPLDCLLDMLFDYG